jgi:hypothetical protein
MIYQPKKEKWPISHIPSKFSGDAARDAISGHTFNAMPQALPTSTELDTLAVKVDNSRVLPLARMEWKLGIGGNHERR